MSWDIAGLVLWGGSMYQPPSLSFSLALSSIFWGSVEVRVSVGLEEVK